MSETPPPHDPAPTPPPPSAPPKKKKKKKKDSSGCLKALAIAAAVLLLLVLIVGFLAYRWWSANKDEIANSTREAVVAGAAAAEGRDEEACVALARERAAGAEGVFEAAGSGMFLRACLENAAESPGLCEGVPASGEFRASIQWVRERCAAEGPGNAASCSPRMQAVQEFCQAGKPKAFRGDPGAITGSAARGGTAPADAEDGTGGGEF